MRCSQCYASLPDTRKAPRCARCEREAKALWRRRQKEAAAKVARIVAAVRLKRLPTVVALPCCYRGCGKESTWRDPMTCCRWSACDEHRIPGDVRVSAKVLPITGTPHQVDLA